MQTKIKKLALVAFHDIRPVNGVGLSLQYNPGSPSYGMYITSLG